MIEGVVEVVVPEARGLGVLVLAHGEEVCLIFARGDDLAFDVLGKLGLEDRVSELFEEDRREVQVAMESDAVALKIAEDAQERKVGFGCGFVEPLDAMRPGSVVDDVR